MFALVTIQLPGTTSLAEEPKELDSLRFNFEVDMAKLDKPLQELSFTCP